MANWQFDAQWGVWVDMDADGVVTSKTDPNGSSQGHDWDHTETYDYDD